MLVPVLAVVALLQQQNSQPTVARVVVTPANPAVVAGDTLRLRAQAFDAQGQAVQNVRIVFNAAGANFEAKVDTAGLLTAGAVGTVPVAAIALVPGGRPITQRLEVRIVPGPAARVAVAPASAKLLVGQRLRLDGVAYSAAGDRRTDRLAWTSSAPGVAQVSGVGVVTAVAPGRATVTAKAGDATQAVTVEVVSANVRSISVTPGATTARTGDVIRFQAVVTDRAGHEINGLTPTWLTTGDALVDDGGAFVGNRAGSYQVTASFGSRSADASVTLSPRDVQREVKLVGKLLRTTFATSEVWIHPNHNVAYLGTHLGGDRVYAIDISNPANPTVVDSIIVNARVINDMMTTPDGNYMVITREGADNRKNGIVIADTHDPLHPKAISEFTDGVTSGVHSAFIHTQEKYGTHVYLTNDGTGALHIIDINDPAHPKEAAQWRPRQTTAGVMLHDIDVQNGLLYASWWNDGLIILDVGNGIKGGTPSKPVVVSQFKYDLDSLYRRVAFEGGPGFIRGTHTAWRHKNYVFIADEVFGNTAAQSLFSGAPSRAHGRLQVIDVTDVEKPRSVAWYEPEYGGVHNVWVLGDTLYIGAYNAGFKAFDVSGELRGDLYAQGRLIGDFMPADPKGKVPNAAMTWGVVVNPKDGLAYVNDFNSGLWVLQLVPKSPVVP
ncbi:MAG TPA: Ig-like domain-containing protein [Gemmatimonadaceae bacterium]|nr:Ig-like domain-containing protein [Gemmatimonadaceae bacterium]